MTTPTPLSTAANPSLLAELEPLFAAAGLRIAHTEAGATISGLATTRITLAPIASDDGRHHTLELSQAFQPAEYTAELREYLSECARRLGNPDPDTVVTLGGLPLRLHGFHWPFHESRSGADTSLVHGEAALAVSPEIAGTGSPLGAKLSASMTVTLREVLRAPEQPFAEAVILNAVRKTFDQGQLELVKSGNRQPVPVTTRFHSPRAKKFVFNDTTEEQRTALLASKAYWLSGVLGAGAPIWLLDPRDAQYTNSSVAELKLSLNKLAEDGLVTLTPDPAFATPTAKLMAREAEYHVALREALAFIKPTFNEAMRSGQTNM